VKSKLYDDDLPCHTNHHTLRVRRRSRSDASGRYTFGCFAVLSAAPIIDGMPLLPTDPLRAGDVHISHRLVVKARTSRPRGFLWEIVREDGHTRWQVSRSLGSYRSMEEAYTHGSAALDLVRFHGASAGSPDRASASPPTSPGYAGPGLSPRSPKAPLAARQRTRPSRHAVDQFQESH
jgi:hypothetical protein